MALTIKDGGLATKDVNAKRRYQFNWDKHLDAAAQINTSTYVITPIGVTESPAALTLDSASLVTGNRKTQFRLSAGTVGVRYKVENKIVTNESPDQEEQKHFFVLITD